jgi:hypothetical protein
MIWHACLALATMLAGCGAPTHETPHETPMSRTPIAQVLAAHTPDLMRVPGVVGTYEGRDRDGAPCVVVMAARITPELRNAIPRTLEGWPVRIEETGELHAMPDSAR